MRKIFTLFIAALCCAGLANATEGALPGGFTINANGDKIQFSKGNLEFNATLGSHATVNGTAQGTWRFAENQWETHTGTKSAESNEWFSSFVYASSGNVYMPYKTYIYDGDCDNNKFGTYGLGLNDWGVYNAISNGGDQVGIWRTLTGIEWSYLLGHHTYAIGTVNNRNGLIILPDDGQIPSGITLITDLPSSWTVNNYNLDDWAKLENAGAVFLPADEEAGFYWASTFISALCRADEVYIRPKGVGVTEQPLMYVASYVRLVQPYEEPEKEPETPEHKDLKGVFSVSADKQVVFAQGNLLYSAKYDKWAFAANQYDMVGENNAKISQNYGGWIDLYGWATGQNPWLATEESSDYGDGNDIAGTNKDWATHTIVNGGDDSWRTLTQEEWTYLLYDRADKANALGTVCGVHGMIILPDNWQQPAGVNFTTSRDNWSVNIYDAGDWSKMENAGAVFLPAAGRRLGTEYEAVDHWGGEWGYYWSSSSRAESTTEAFYIYFAEATISYMNQYRYYGYSVRPAHDVKANEGIENTQKEDSEKASKLLRDGVLYIERNGKTYNAQGAEVK